MFPTRALTFSLLFATIFLTGCEKENAFDCLKSTGSIQTETRNLPSFRTLMVYDNLEVIVVPDSQTFVEVTSGENLLKNIITEVKNGKLEVRNINKCNWVRNYEKPLKVRVHVPKLTDIFHDGDGTLSSENTLPADTLFLHVTGAGDTDFKLQTTYFWVDMYELGEVRLQGSSRYFTGLVLSQGSLKANDLKTWEANLKLTGQGGAFLSVEHFLSAVINGPGNVYYRGTPAKVETFGKGPGQVKVAN